MGSALFTVAIPQEMQFIHQYLISKGGDTATPFHESRSNYTFAYTLPNGEGIDLSFHVMNEMGNVASASIGYRGLIQANPQYAFLLGIAGSMDDAARLGDVVIATSVKHLSPDAIKKLVPGMEFASSIDDCGVQSGIDVEDEGSQQVQMSIDPRKKIFNNSYSRYLWRSIDRSSSQFAADDYLSHFNSLREKPKLKSVTSADTPNLDPAKDNPIPRVHRGTLLGSDVVVDSDEYVQFVKDRNDDPERSLYYFKSYEEAKKRNSWFPAPLLAVDMETYGFFRMAEAVYGPSSVPAFFSVRGISDLASDKSVLDNDTEGSVRRRATENAFIIALDMLNYLVQKRVRSTAP